MAFNQCKLLMNNDHTPAEMQDGNYDAGWSHYDERGMGHQQNAYIVLGDCY